MCTACASSCTGYTYLQPEQDDGSAQVPEGSSMELDEAQADVGQEHQEIGDRHAGHGKYAPAAYSYSAHAQAMSAFKFWGQAVKLAVT